MTTHQDATTACRHLGCQLRELREGRGLSDRDLAVQAGMLPSTVVAIENGLDCITIGTVARVANALGYDLTLIPRVATVTPIGDRLAKRGWRVGDSEPLGVTQVQDSEGDVWHRWDDGWRLGRWSKVVDAWKWADVVHDLGPVTEVADGSAS